MSVLLLNALPAGAVEILTDATGAPYFKSADLGRYLEIVDIGATYRNVETKTRCNIAGGPTQRKYDAFVDLEGAMSIILGSNKARLAI